MDVDNLPVIAGVIITRDGQGRFNLNALHKASRLGSAKQPSNWLRLDSTQSLVDELANSSDMMSSPVVQKEGRNGGTFAHELLAISYAGWISPSFQLQVNQTFLDYKAGKLQPAFNPAQLSRMDILTLAMEAEKEKQEALEEAQRLNQLCNTITRQFVPGETAPRFCMQLNGVNTQQVNAWLVAKGHVIKEKRGHRPSAYTRDRYFKLKTTECEDGEASHQPQLTLKGAKWLYKQYLDGQLPMKKNWDGRFSHWVQADPAFVVSGNAPVRVGA